MFHFDFLKKKKTRITPYSRVLEEMDLRERVKGRRSEREGRLRER